MNSTIASQAAPASRVSASLPWFCLALAICAGCGLWTYSELRSSTSATWQDTSGYLAHALYIREHGGFIGFLRECFQGTFPITERHPLYMLLLAPFASRTAGFFWAAKIVSLVTGLIVLACYIGMVWRRYGREAAMLAGIAYALSASLVIASANVANETIFVLCTLWLWWLLTEPGRGEAAAVDAGLAPTQMPVSVTRWALAGVALGLAYLAKSPAILIAVAVVVAGAWHAGLRFLIDRRFLAFVATALLVASPLLVRNVIGYGTPLYEGMNSNITWIDDWTDMGAEHSSMYFDRYGVVTIEVNGMPTARDYMNKHDVGDIASRLVGGGWNELTSVAPKALAFVVPPRGRMALLWGAALLVLGVVGWWMRRRSWEAALVFFWSGAFIVFFGWDHMFPEIRYLAPLVPVWIAFAAHSLWRLASTRVRPRLAAAVAAGLSSLFLVVAGAWTVGSGRLTQPQPVMARSPSYDRLNEWFDRTIVAGDRVMLGPTREFHGLAWVLQAPIAVVLAPNSTSLEAFQAYLHDRKVRYLVMHPENVAGEGGRLKAALAPYFEVSSSGEIVEKQVLPGWRAVFVDPGTPRRFIVYESIALGQAPGKPSP